MSTSEQSLRHGPDIFVSYRRTNKEFVEKLVAVVEAFGPSVWWDAEIEGGKDWRESMGRAPSHRAAWTRAAAAPRLG